MVRSKRGDLHGHANRARWHAQPSVQGRPSRGTWPGSGITAPLSITVIEHETTDKVIDVGKRVTPRETSWRPQRRLRRDRHHQGRRSRPRVDGSHVQGERVHVDLQPHPL